MGHEDCSVFLENQLTKLLLHTGTPVCTDALDKFPDIEEVKQVLLDSNLNATPGINSITSLL